MLRTMSSRDRIYFTFKMKIELASIISTKQELPWLDFGLESILENTKNDIVTTVYVSRCYDFSFMQEVMNVCKKYGVIFSPQGDNFPIGYVNESKTTGFEINDADCVISIHPDVVFTKKDVFDDVVDEASEYFDSKYAIYVSSDSPDDIQPMGITIHTKLGWEKIGCEDINFYPQAGVEHDYHRRAYLEWGFDPNDKNKYWEPIKGTVMPDWVFRIRHPECLHLMKSWNTDPRLAPPSKFNYAAQLLQEVVLEESHTSYHRRKWGGFFGGELFLKPFDSEKYNNRIAPENRFNPYADYDTIPILRGMLL